MTEIYLWITRNEDGEVTISEMTKQEINSYLRDMLSDNEGDMSHYTFLDKIPKDSDIQMWGGDNMNVIIKGRLVVPQTKKLVTELEVE